MIHTMWKSMDDYMAMYLKTGQKDEVMEDDLTLMYELLLFFQEGRGTETQNLEEVLEVKQ